MILRKRFFLKIRNLKSEKMTEDFKKGITLDSRQ